MSIATKTYRSKSYNEFHEAICDVGIVSVWVEANGFTNQIIRHCDVSVQPSGQLLVHVFDRSSGRTVVRGERLFNRDDTEKVYMYAMGLL